MRYLSIVLCTALLFTVSCGGGGSSGGDGPVTIDASDYYYQAGNGDEITYSETFSTGGGSVTTLVRSTFSEVNDIPPGYNYSGPVTGPYLLETIHENEEGAGYILAGYVYSTLDGEEIIDDDRVNFTNVDESVTTGDDEPSQVVIGQSYTSTIEEDLFATADGALVGSRSITATITPSAIETITVDGGTFEALKFVTSSTSVEEINHVTTTSTASGTLWYGKGAGLVKAQLALVVTEDGGAPTNVDYVSELVNGPFASSAILPASSQIASPSTAIPVHFFMRDIARMHRVSVPQQ